MCELYLNFWVIVLNNRFFGEMHCLLLTSRIVMTENDRQNGQKSKSTFDKLQEIVLGGYVNISKPRCWPY